MQFNPDKEFVIGYVLQELAKDVETTVSKLYKIGDKVQASELDELAKNMGMVFEWKVVPISNSNMIKISIIDVKEKIHLTALEYLVGEE